MTTNKEDKILYLNRKDVVSVCADVDVVAAIRDVFKLHGLGQTVLPDEAYLGWTTPQGETVRSLSLPGYVGGSLNSAGTKIINANIANPSRGLPRASGLTMIYDSVSVRVNCVMDSAYISSLRTAGVSALSAELFKGREIESLALIGAGVLAQAHIELLAKTLPHLRVIRIFDISTERVAALRAAVESVLQAKGIALQEISNAEEAIRGAQLIVPVTTTTTGYIQYDWLQPGAILVNISLDDPLPEVVLRADRVIVDDWKLVRDDPRRLIGRMYRAGQIIGPDESVSSVKDNQRCIDAQLGDVVISGKGKRSHLDDIILVNPFGLAIEDVALATHVYRKALQLGIGVWLDR
jgi:ornithine cyclodeaminase/alanine dehydrogenase-like protein (mu-crystallin family)